jgi:hypothetical protein
LFNIKVTTAIVFTSVVTLLASVNPANAGEYSQNNSDQEYQQDRGENQYERHHQQSETNQEFKEYQNYNKYHKRHLHQEFDQDQIDDQPDIETNSDEEKGAACYDRPCYEP